MDLRIHRRDFEIHYGTNLLAQTCLQHWWRAKLEQYGAEN